MAEADTLKRGGNAEKLVRDYGSLRRVVASQRTDRCTQYAW
jgi:hypothetical protein